MTRPQDIEALLRHVKPFGSFLEPCVGTGNIMKAVLPFVGPTSWAEITQGRDFLADDAFVLSWDWIITNPPFSLAREFIEKSLRISCHVAMLLPMGFYASAERFEWWQDKLPTAQYVLHQRPWFLDWDGKRVLGKNGKPGTDSATYAWLVWSRLYSGIHVI
jgi:hypothetical protein